VTFRFCDESDYGFGWVAEDKVQRCSHALLADGVVWVVDPVAWPEAEERLRAFGEPGGVLQLLDRHNRDCAAVAERLGVPHLRVPDVAAPFEVVPVVDVRIWRERALWWTEHRLLLVPEAVGTGPFYTSREERLAVSPLLRLTPPRRLEGFEPEHLLVGHGAGVHDDAADTLRHALGNARRGLPRWAASHFTF
jgi:hypothetical protein